MRLHRLVVQAFGPFAERVEIDLDALAAGGIFLIHGPTGAGKTSLLDAICYALYAGVPGSRPSGRSLRSDHAQRADVPLVELEFTAAGRRLRVRRSPEHRRLKRRGSGETTVAATATMEELGATGWVPVASGAQDVGMIVRDAVGLGLEQFAKVALLPQGEFAAFLRANAEQRREVLERLFDVSRFTDIEAWLAQARREGADDVARAEAGLAHVGDRLGDLLTRLPAGVVATAPDWTALTPEEVAQTLRRATSDLAGYAATTLAGRDEAEAAERAATGALDAARRVADDRRKGLGALESLRALQEREPALQADAAAVDAHHRAAALRGELDAYGRATAAADAAEGRLDAAREGLRGLGMPGSAGEADVSALVAAVAEHDDLVGDCARMMRERDATDAERAALASVAQAALDACGSVETRRATLVERSAGLADVAAARPEHAIAHERASAALQALEATLARRIRLDDQAATIAGIEVRVSAARDDELRLRDRWLTLRRAQLDGMSARLAADLADGHPCPVCGSPTHPAPAETSDAVGEEQVADAERGWRHAEVELGRAREALARARAEHSEGETALGPETRDVPALRAAVSDQRTSVRSQEQSRAAADAAVAEFERTRVDLVEVDRRLADARAAVADAHGRLAAVDRQVRRVERAMERSLDRHTRCCPCASTGSGTDVLARHREVAAALGALAQADERAGRARDERQAAQAALTGAVLAQGFDGPAAASAALLSTEQVEALTQALAAAARARVEAQTVLQDPDIAAALSAPQPGLPGLVEAAQLASDRRRGAERAHADAEAADRELGSLAPALADTLARLSRAAERHATVSRLADAVAGLGPDNTLRMRLSAFVLAARLERVVALANERLARLGDGRYRLAHSDALAPGGRRSGLGLQVQDLWTGLARDTATLSGGESFMASLALALGLADAVREHARGGELQTLFVDEGFGTLDDESLDEVMAVLDDLRGGGRCVGVVSHVADLRTRITSQVRVDKSAHGSTVRVVAGAGADSAA